MDLLLSHADINPELQSRQLAAWATQEFELDPPMSHVSVCRILKHFGFRHWKIRKIPNLTANHKLRRVNWCHEHINFDWSKVFFTDETYFTVYRGKNGYWALAQPTLATPLFSSKIGIWAGFSLRGKSNLIIFSESIDSEKYQDILNEGLIEVAKTLYPDGFYLMYGNARPLNGYSLASSRK